MTIPASEIVAINPGVIGTGGSPLSLNGVFMSKNSLIPAATVQPFGSTTAVKNFFGPSSTEYALSQTYFLGYDNSTIKPGTIIFAPYHDDDVAAWLQSGSLAGMTLTELQDISGTLIITVDGDVFTSATINLSAAASFTAAAVLIAAGFTGTGHPDVVWNSVNSTFTISSTGTGVESTITYCTGTISTDLKFTSATGALISQGADEDTPETAMDNVKDNTQNWVAFTTMWEPDLIAKENFAIWNNNQNQRYAYIAWDTDAQAIVSGSTTNFGYICDNLEYDGISCNYNSVNLASFILGTIACMNFNQTNGRITTAFKHQAGFEPTVTDQQISENLISNGYSFYGSYATANDQFNFYYNGHVSGRWKWLDTYINQIYLNSQFQLALMTVLNAVNAIAYNQAGYNLIRAAMQDPIAAALNSGIIRTGILLSQSQKAQLQSAAGLDVSSIVEQQGYYLQILDPGAQVRGERGTPVINFWYTDGGAVQKITVASIDIM